MYQISEWYEHFSNQSYGWQTQGDLWIRCLIRYWNRPRDNTQFLVACIKYTRDTYQCVSGLSWYCTDRWEYVWGTTIFIATLFIPTYMRNETHTLRLRQNGCHFSNHIFRCIFLNENALIWIKICWSFPKVPIDNIPALVKIMAWRWPSNKP